MMPAASTPLLDFYRWGFPAAPLQVHLSLEVVNGIRRQIQDSGDAPGALSQCGLLLGISHPGITRILDFEPLPVLDTTSLEAAMLGVSGEVVGFYRTISPGNPAMSNEDRNLAEKFPQPSSVFLLVETIKSSIGTARFCFWGESGLFDQPVAVFPFAAEELVSREPQARPGIVRKLSQGLRPAATQMTSPADQKAAAAELGPRVAATQTELQPVAVPAPVSAPPSDPRLQSIAPATHPPQPTSRPWLAWLLLAGVLVVSLSLGAFSYFRPGSRLPVVPQAAASPGGEKTLLGLAVEKRGEGLLVSWNGNAPIVGKANFGMLLIRGTGVSRDVPLTEEELRAGGFVYTLAADELRFQLNVVAGEQVAREFLTVVRPKAPEGSASPGNSTTAALPASPVSKKPAPQPPKEIREFKPLDAPKPAAAPLRLEEPPAAAGGAPAPNTGTLSVLNRPAVAVPAPADVQAREIPQSVPPPSGLSVAARPPVATHQVMPAVPVLLRGHLWNATLVEVKVSVDALGSVVKAEAVAKPGLHPLLRDEAVQAARRWKFQPALFNGHPVPAETVVQFNFAPSR